MRRMPYELSAISVMANASTGWKKLGQPVPLSNLVSDENSGSLQQMQRKVPSTF